MTPSRIARNQLAAFKSRNFPAMETILDGDAVLETGALGYQPVHGREEIIRILRESAMFDKEILQTIDLDDRFCITVSSERYRVTRGWAQSNSIVHLVETRDGTFVRSWRCRNVEHARLLRQQLG